MREVAVVETGDREHVEQIHGERDGNSDPTPANPDHGDACDVEANKRQAPDPVDLVARGPLDLAIGGVPAHTNA
jgi:hypothetical protein